MVAGPVHVPLVPVSAPNVVVVPVTTGTAVLAGFVVTVTTGEMADASGPCVLARSITAPDRRISVSVPSGTGDARVAVTVYGPVPDPVTPATTQPVEVPPKETSLVVSPLTS